MIVQFWVGDKRLEDVIANGGFLYISEIGPVCDEICVCVEMIHAAPPATPFLVSYGCQIAAEQLLENPRAEAALKPGVVRSEDTV